MTTKNLDAALLKFQQTVGNPPKNAVNPHFKSKYTTLDALYDHVRGPLADLGVVMTNGVEFVGDGSDKFVVKTTVTHAESGESRYAIVPIMAEGSGPQKFGSAVTYACRQGVMSLLALAGDPDDDGHEAQKKDRPKPKPQVETLDEDVAEDMARLRQSLAKLDGEAFKAAVAEVKKRGMDLRDGTGVTRESLDALKKSLNTESK